MTVNPEPRKSELLTTQPPAVHRLLNKKNEVVRRYRRTQYDGSVFSVYVG